MSRPFLYLCAAVATLFPVAGLNVNPGAPGAAWAAPGSGSEGTPDDKIEEDIEDDVEEEIENDIEDDVEDDIESDIEDEVESDIEDDVEDSVEDDVEDDVEAGVESRIEDRVNDKIDDKVEDNSGSGKAIDRDVEGSVESRIEAEIENKSGSGGGDVFDERDVDVEDQVAEKLDDQRGSGGRDDPFDDDKAVAKEEFEAARDASDFEHDAARAAARAARDTALALPGANEDAIRAEYELAKNVADGGRDEAREEAEASYATALASIESAEEEEGESSGSSNSRSGSSNAGSGDGDDDDNSGSGSSNSGPGNNNDDDDDDDDNEDHDNSGSGSSNSGNRNSARSRGVFAVALDEDGHEIERGEWLMLVPPDAVKVLAERGFAAKEIETLDGLNLVLARVKTPDQFSIKETEAAIRDAAPEAKVDFNHVYRRHKDRPETRGDRIERRDYRPEIKRTRRERHGAIPTDLYDLPDVSGGEGLTIGIIDTKVDVTHASLQNARVLAQNFVPYEHEQPESHGTSVASIIVGGGENYHGLLPKADVYAASVFFESPTGAESATTTSLVRALDWMTENKVSVVNMSLTGPPNAILKSAIDRAYEKGTIVVAAVGNNGPAAPPLYPAAYDNVVAVTAVTRSNKVYRLANQGDHVDFAAPGVNVLHAKDHGDFVSSSGTSMAAPFVTAILAISSDENGHITQDQLSRLAEKAQDLGRRGFDPVYGNGLIRPLAD